MAQPQLTCASKKLDLSRPPIIVGVLNVTPDSFSDGGEYLDPTRAIDRGLEMADQGAGVLDVGGESSRPGADPVDAAEQARRVIPVIDGLAKQTNIPISIDTTNSKVAAAALDAGAVIVNDISALRFDEQMASVAAKHRAAVVLMHMQGKPQTMQKTPRYVNPVQEVKTFLAERIEFAKSQGIADSAIVVDPGIGFGKTANHNLLLLREMSEFHSLQTPILAGVSRKRFVGEALGLEDPQDRLIGTAAAVAWCVAANVQLIRVHDVKEMVQVAKMINAIGAGRVLPG